MGLSTYILHVNAPPKQKHAMRHGMRNLHGLKLRRYDAHLIDLNEYLAAIPVAKASDKIGDTENKKTFCTVCQMYV